jgi:D-alanyl-lipoteichoic acid acyltransferase DltB (MBOAT superfamily)
MAGPLRRFTARTRLVLAVWLTFFVSGIWHGTGWNYVIFGLWHCLFIFVGVGLAKALPAKLVEHPALAPLKIAATFAVVCVSFLFFREADVSYILRILLHPPADYAPMYRQAAIYFAGLTALYSIPLWIHAAWDAKPRRGLSPAGQAALGAALFMAILLLGLNSQLDFVYAQF